MSLPLVGVHGGLDSTIGGASSTGFSLARQDLTAQLSTPGALALRKVTTLLQGPRRDAPGEHQQTQELYSEALKVATMTRLKVERRKDPILLAAVKTGRRSVRNRAELLEWLAAAAQSRRLSFEKLDFDMPLKEQARLLAASQLLVASMGATLMAGLLLSADAALLALPACHKVGPGRSVTCETEELLKSCGLRWAQYPVAFDDVFYTIGRGFDFTARREIVNELIKELLEDPEAARTHTKLKKEVRLLRFQSCVTHALLISFEILLILRLEGVMTASWVVVISPWLALEVWWFLFRLYVSPVAWALSDPQAATEAGAAQAEVKRTPLFWLFLVGYLQAGFFRFLTSILISARANADGHPHAVSWWLVFLPLYFSVALFVAIPCLERVVKRRRQGLLRQEEDNPGPVAAKGCVATVWLMMLWLAAGKFDGGAYSAAWVFSPIFFFVSLAVCIVGMVIILARPQHFQRAAESMGEPIGKPAETE